MAGNFPHMLPDPQCLQHFLFLFEASNICNFPFRVLQGGLDFLKQKIILFIQMAFKKVK